MNVSQSVKTLGAVLLTGSVIAACGGSGNGGSAGGPGGATSIAADPVAKMANAITKTSTANTVKIHGTVAVAGTTATLDGRERTSPDLAQDMTIQAQGSLAAQLGGSGSFEERLIGGVIYVKLGPQVTGSASKPWVKLDLSKAAGLSGLNLNALTGKSDPADSMRQLLASGDVHAVGSQTVDGVKTTHYSGTVDPAKVLDNSAAGAALTAQQRQQIKAALDQAGVTQEQIDVWVAANGLPAEVKVAANSAAGTLTSDLHLSDWGKPVSVSAPPADQVIDVSALIPQ